MKSALKSLKDATESKTFKFENDSPHPFDRAITMTPFPKHFEIPKFDKFREKVDPIMDVKDFYMHCQEMTYNDIFLMCLFPKFWEILLLDGFFKYPNVRLTPLLIFQKLFLLNMLT